MTLSREALSAQSIPHILMSLRTFTTLAFAMNNTASVNARLSLLAAPMIASSRISHLIRYYRKFFSRLPARADGTPGLGFITIDIMMPAAGFIFP